MQPDIFAFMNCCVLALIAVYSDILAGSSDSIYEMAYAKDGFGVKPSPLSLMLHKTLLPAQKVINCFRILLLVNLST